MLWLGDVEKEAMKAAEQLAGPWQWAWGVLEVMSGQKQLIPYGWNSASWLEQA
jgi:hypothetical protein